MKKILIPLFLFFIVLACNKPRGGADIVSYNPVPAESPVNTYTMTVVATPVFSAVPTAVFTQTATAPPVNTPTITLSATITHTATITPTVNLPNLYVQSFYTQYEVVPHCLTWTANYMPKITNLWVWIRNNGTLTASAPFTVSLVNSGVQAVCTAQITPGYNQSVIIDGSSLTGIPESIMIDSGLQIAESNEADNLYPLPYVMPTVIPTCDNTCYSPAIGHGGPGESEQLKYYSVDAGSFVTAMVYSNYPGVDLTMEYLDGCGIAKRTVNINTGASSYYTDSFSMDGTGCPGIWEIRLIQNSAQIDSENFTATSGPAPTPTSTPPCMNMPIMTADELYTLHKYKFNRNGCSDIYYWNRWSTVSNGSIAVYNSLNALVQVTAFSGQAKAKYRIKPTDPAGAYRIVTFNAGDTPPAVYSSMTGVGGCTAVVAGVQ